MKQDTITALKIALLSGGGAGISLAEIESYLRIVSILTGMVLSVLVFIRKTKKDESESKKSDKTGNN
jgi:hypothetical protein